MAFPAQFQFANEDDFSQRLLVPLIQRLGFSLVINYHGTSELGKDLIFAEIDRFGHVRYHGLQAKYVPSISLNDVEELVADCRQAFANPFTHPQTGTVERISSFYVATGGSLGADALGHYFNSLRPSFAGNVHLLQGKDLVTLDRWASVNRVGSVEERVSGVLLELRFNRYLLQHICTSLEQEGPRPLERLRLVAMSAYLSNPALTRSVKTEDVNSYWHLCATGNNALDFTGIPLGVSKENRDELTTAILKTFRPKITELSLQIETAMVSAMQALGPLVPV